MKQKKFGKKIQNWHRPLGPSQLRQRFLRQRYQDTEYTNRGQHYSNRVEVDDYWNCYDPQGCDCCRADPEDIDRYELDVLLQSVINRPSLRQSFTSASGSLPDKTVENNAPPLLPQHLETGIEERLAAHIDNADRISSNAASLRTQLIEATADWRDIDVIKRVADRYPNVHLAKQICFFSPFWVRSPRTWNEHGNTHLLDHLFGLYEIPAFLYPAWFRRSELSPFKWLCWFVLLGLGGSLKRAAEHFNWTIPAKFLHYLREAPADASPTEACLLAEVKRIGGFERDVERILRNAAFVIDPTERSANESYTGFWRDTVRWLIDHGDDISDEQSDLILSWAMHQYTETERLRLRPFSWKGRRVRTVIDRSIEYRRELERPWSRYHWRGHGWDWVLDDPTLGQWSFVELTSGEALFHEGRAMHHCVSSYAARCAAGHSAIVSIRCRETRRLTVEIAPRTGHVVQARGPYNRQASADERSVLALWIKTIVQPSSPVP